jgi:hypothetical protein
MEPIDPLVERILKDALGNNTNTTVVKLEGQGPLWGALAVGVALGAAVACTAWVASTLGDLTDDQRNDDAFIQATYQQAPQIRDEFNRIKAEQESKK